MEALKPTTPEQARKAMALRSYYEAQDRRWKLLLARASEDDSMLDALYFSFCS
jgi:hypothetical protein